MEADLVDLKKLVRTGQNYFPGLVELKNDIYHVLRSRLHLAHEPDFAVIAALPQQPGDLFLDIGGNRGQSIISMRKYRPDVPIISFEPSLQFYTQLVRRFGSDSHLTIENFGLGAEAQALPLFIPSYRGFLYCGAASFNRDHVHNVLNRDTIYGFDSKHVTVQESTCTIKTLDSLDLAPSFIKIDVEGFEHDVLRGGREMLRRHEPALLFESTWTDPGVFSLLAELEYQEVVFRHGRVTLGHSDSDNALYMTAKRLVATGH